VYDNPILNGCFIADDDRSEVASDDCSRPDPAIPADPYISYDVCPRSNPGIIPYDRGFPIEFVDRHILPLWILFLLPGFASACYMIKLRHRYINNSMNYQMGLKERKR
jgi:hypothetical protein